MGGIVKDSWSSPRTGFVDHEQLATTQRTSSAGGGFTIDRSQGTIRKDEHARQILRQAPPYLPQLDPETRPSMFRVVCGGFC